MVSVDTPTPEERDERIAQLRRKRRARVRFLAIRGGIVAAALAVLAIGLLYWLLTTVGGRDLLLAQIVSRLPADATLDWREAEGPAAGPLTLRDVVFTMPRLRNPNCVPTAESTCATGTLRFTAQRLTVDAALRPLLTRTLRLDALVIEGATLDLPPNDEPFELPRWPDVLPEIAPPLTVRVKDVRIDDLRVSSAGEPSIHVRRVRGALAADDGELHLHDIVIDSDRGRLTADVDYVPAENYRADLVITAVLPAAERRTQARLGLVARGDLSRMVVGIGGRAPGPLRATLTLRGQENPRWELRAQADALDPGLLTGGTQPPVPDPIVAQLQANGVGGRAQLQGSFTRGDVQVDVRPSQLHLEEQVLAVEPLALELLGGSASLRGQADFSNPDDRRFKFGINARGLTWGGGEVATADAPVIVADMDAGIAGTLEAWAATGNARLSRDGEAAQVQFEGRGNTESVDLRELVASMPTGTLRATGHVAWAPTLGWDLDATLAGFDPGYFVSGWDGAVNGRIASEAVTRDDGGLDVRIDAPQLGGRLRGRPLDGSGELAIRAPAPGRSFNAYEGQIALSLGGSRIDARGSVTDAIDVDVRFAPLRLADLLPDGSGTLSGSVRLTGERTAPDIVADLTGDALAYGDYRADSFSAQGRLPWRGSGGDLTIRASRLQAGIAFQTLRIDASGAVESLQVDAQADGDIGALSLRSNANKRGSAWQGSLASLQLAPARGAQWSLQQPVAFGWDAGNMRLSQACLASSAGGSLCASADWPRQGVTVQGRALPLSLAEAYLPKPDDDGAWLLRGELAIDADLRPVGNQWRGEARITSADGGLRMSERARRNLVGYQDLTVQATFGPQRLTAELTAALDQGGRIDASVATGWDAFSPLIGQIEVATDQLTWMELFSPDIVDPQGRLDGRIGLSGTRSEPVIDGRAELTGFTAEVPSLGITVQNGSLRLDAMPDGSARIAGSMATSSGSGNDGGVLNIDGTLGWRGRETPLVLNIRGEDVLVSDTRDLRAVASPDVEVRYTAGQAMRVSGTVRVPSATLDLERLDSGVSPSPDVVVLDPVDPEGDGLATALEMDLTLVLGEDVVLHGFGLDGGLDGQLRVGAVPGREMRATGRLQISGEYAAYGQELQIQRGFLTWSESPIGDPLLDIRAERKVGQVTAGVDVSGRASTPRARVWSDPASSESEALALLALGRPLSTVTGDERNQISAASAALSAGSGILASQLGSRIGLDEAGVIQSRALGGNVLGVGKFISPRLFVGYGVSLLGTGQLLTLKYLIGRGFDVELESSTVENRGSINWRMER